MKCNCNICSGYLYSTNPARNNFNECVNKCVNKWDGNIEVNNNYNFRNSKNNMGFTNCICDYDEKCMLVKQAIKIIEIASQKRELAIELQNKSDEHYREYRNLEEKSNLAWQEYEQLIKNANSLMNEVNKCYKNQFKQKN